MNCKYIILLVVMLFGVDCSLAQQTNHSVQVSGAMWNVMRQGQLHGTIYLDTISNKKHLYGLGPKEYLRGELLIIDGKSFVSSMSADGAIIMEETYAVKAPFLVYTNNEDWELADLPKDVRTMRELEEYLDKISIKIKRPFAFKLQGTFSTVDFHIQNLPEGTVVRSFADAHQGQGKFQRKDIDGTIIGFFSTEHQSIFTHHDSYIHMHFIDADHTEMGHVDDVLFDGTARIELYLPTE